MKKSNALLIKLSAVALILFIVFASVNTFAQDGDRKAKVTIKKSNNGTETEVNENINIEDAKDLQLLLEKYGVDTELEELKNDEVLEITIKRMKDGEPDNLTITVDPQNFQNKFKNYMPKKETIAFLGVHGETKCINGVVENGTTITKVIEDSKAAEYGLEAGDIITKIGNTEIKGFRSLRDAIRTQEPGDKVKIEFVRDGKTKTKTIELGSTETEVRVGSCDKVNWMPRDFHHMRTNNRSFLGVTFNSEKVNTYNKGVIIDKVVKNSTAEKIGLKDGDVVTKLNGIEVNAFSELAEEISKMEIGESVEVEYLRNGNTSTATGTMQSRASGCGENIFQFDKEKMEEHMERLNEKLDQGLFDLEFLGPELEDMQIQLGEMLEEMKIKISLSPITDEELESTGISKSAVNSLEVNKFNFYPNPNNGIFSVEFELENEADTEVRVFNLSGIEIYFEEIPGFSGIYQRDFDLSKEAKGNYFVQISREGKATTKKLIVQ